MNNLKATLPPDLQKIVNAAREIETARKETANLAVRLIDATTLKSNGAPMVGVETADEIKALCKSAKYCEGSCVAAVCVYPNQTKIVKDELSGTDIKVAVVNNFPHGDQTAEEAAADAAKAIDNGADEIDTVIDYEALDAGNIDDVKNKLNAVRDVCKLHGTKLKTILKSSVYENYDELYNAAKIAIECGADFVKTCTGKVPKAGYGTLGIADSSTLEIAATVMQAVADSGRSDVGVKISGGVKTPEDCERMRYLADQILGEEYFKDNTKLRIGASSLLNNLFEFVEK